MDAVAHTWRILRRGKPGERFVAYYTLHESRETRRGHRGRIAVAVLFVVIGFVLLFIPGPGIVFLAVGAAMLARESLSIARLFDRMEVALRRLLRRRAPAGSTP